MTKEILNKYWEAIVALKEGRRIQYQTLMGEWVETTNFYGDYPYRIMPEPREFYINPDSLIAHPVHSYSKELLEDFIHVMEVL